VLDTRRVKSNKVIEDIETSIWFIWGFREAVYKPGKEFSLLIDFKKHTDGRI
jgi:hypothetical protein